MEVTLLMRALRGLFKSKTDLGSRFQARFNPMPLPTIAFLLTIVSMVTVTF